MRNASTYQHTFVVETVTLESDVKGEGSGEEITSQVIELKHVVMEKMNGI